MSFRIERGQIIPDYNSKTGKAKESPNYDFHRLLQQSISKTENVKISAHAQQRMLERDIKLQQSDIKLINQAMNDLEKKGARESLMLYKDLAFIASINNRTIITAIESKDMDVVTNIDSAIIIK